MKKLDISILLALAALFGFFIATANDRGRYIISVLPLIAMVVIAFRPQKK